MVSFATRLEAVGFVEKEVDKPVADFTENLGGEMTFKGFTLDLGGDRFTNVYDLSFPASTAKPDIALHRELTSVYDHVKEHPDIRGAINGGFFFLADQSSIRPVQPSLNLAMADGLTQGLPVVDREALFIEKNGRMSAEYTRALGELSLNKVGVNWFGSLTDHEPDFETDALVYGPGNSVINHVRKEGVDSIRVLDEDSRYTPPIKHDDVVDIGFMLRDDGVFEGVSTSATGKLDIFSHHAVIRTHERHAHEKLPEMRVRSIGNRALGSLQGALSTGPMLSTADFAAHPLNNDRSLGSSSPLEDRPLPRAVIYETANGRVHARIFDGRPGSKAFTGVTPTEAAQLVMSEEEIAWGCFLDSGQTAKLVTRMVEEGEEGVSPHMLDLIKSWGNSHYLVWPEEPGGDYLWDKRYGRPTSSMVTFTSFL